MKLPITLWGATAIAVLAGLQPAIGKPTATQKCAAGKMTATGAYAACRMRAEARTERTGKGGNFRTCSKSHTAAFKAIEKKQGAACPTLGDAAAVQVSVAVDFASQACRFKAIADPGPPAGAAIVVVQGIQVTQSSDSILEITNPTITALNAYCFYAGDPNATSTCSMRDFVVTVPAQSTVSWLASVGNAAPLLIPTTDVPFSGVMVCLQVNNLTIPFIPTSASNMVASVTPPGGCKQAGLVIANGDGNNGDTILRLGGGAYEYGPCPASIGAARIQSCWSNSEFTFQCN